MHYFKQFPNGFKHIFYSQACYNMGFFSLKSLFILYMLHQFNINQSESFTLFAAFMTLCYATSFFGSYMADKILGPRQTLIWGGILTSIGISALYVPNIEFLYISLALVSLGSGFFKPNFSTALSLLFDNPEDNIKKAAFSKLYVAMNVGALIGISIISLLKRQDNWYYSLIFVALSFILSALSFYKMPHTLHLRHTDTKLDKTSNTSFSIALILLTLIISYLLFKNIKSFDYVMKIIMITSGIYFCHIFHQCDNLERRNLIKLLVYYVLFIFSCSLIEQECSSLMIFIDTKVDRQIFGMTVSAPLFMTINPALVLVFSSMSTFLSQLDKYGPENSDFLKFTIGYGLLSLSFGVLAISDQLSNQSPISIVWVLASFVFQTMGEWLIVPVGFAIASRYAPVRYLSVIISFWMLGIAYAHLVAGKLAYWSLHTSSTDIAHHSDNYTQFFSYLFMTSGAVFILLMCNQYRIMKARTKIL